jgi:DNA polymerase III alpha subunit
MMQQMGFSPRIFVIVWDCIKYARDKDTLPTDVVPVNG